MGGNSHTMPRLSRILPALALVFAVAPASAAMPAQMRQVTLSIDGFYLSGGTAYVAAYERYAQLSQAEAEAYVAQGQRWAADLSGRFDCFRESSAADCVFVPKGELTLVAAMPETELAKLSSRRQVADALTADVRMAPELAKGDALAKSFADMASTVRAQNGYLARHLLVLNRLTYATANRETDTTLHSGMNAWNSGKGVCDAYARLALYVTAVSKLPARVVTGDAYDAITGKPGPHAWLMIGPYLLDPTFDDAAVLRAGGAREDRTKAVSDITYFALSGDLATADRTPDGSPKKDLSPAATDARYYALAAKAYKGPAAKLLAPYAKKRALGMGASDDIPTTAQLAAFSANGSIVVLSRDYTYACGASTCSASGRKYLPLSDQNRGFIFQKFTLDRIRSLSVVKMRDGTLAAFPPEGQGLD